MKNLINIDTPQKSHNWKGWIAVVMNNNLETSFFSYSIIEYPMDIPSLLCFCFVFEWIREMYILSTNDKTLVNRIFDLKHRDYNQKEFS
jgi:hypothetical protein